MAFTRREKLDRKLSVGWLEAKGEWMDVDVFRDVPETVLSGRGNTLDPASSGVSTKLLLVPPQTQL